MSVRKRINFKKVNRVIIDDRVKQLRKEAGNIEVGIINRTQGGKDVDSRSFKPYSKAYARQKVSNKVNLTKTGAMLQAISHKAIPMGIRFYFSARAETNKAYWNQKTRKFFGVDRKQVKYIKSKLGRLERH